MHRNKLRGRGKQMGNVWQEKEVVKKEKMGLEGKGGGIVMGKRRRRGGGWDCKGGRMGREGKNRDSNLSLFTRKPLLYAVPPQSY